MEPNSREVPISSGAAIESRGIKRVFKLKNLKWVVLLAAGITAFFILFGSGGKFFIGPRYAQAYSLVDETVSKSAPISVNLPKGISSKGEVQIAIFPEIQGDWLDSGDEKTRVFKPKKDMTVGSHYSVTLSAGDVQLKEDFLVAENPTIAAVFPKEDSETSENSEISFIFNRPMVPLTTLEELDTRAAPVSIVPETKGKFKWISTRNLQFIPEERLVRSSNYTVNFEDGFVSVEGLPVNGKKFSFVTRPLRVNSFPGSWNQISHNQPLWIVFNQPVDLDRTASQIEVRDGNNNLIDTVIEYGTESYYDEEVKEQRERPNTSVINIFQKKDKHGRSKTWDYDTDYIVKMEKAFPEEGDVIVDQKFESRIGGTGFVSRVHAISERDTGVTQYRFDPEGKLKIDFFEPVDIRRTKITSEFLKNISYYEECEDVSDDPETCDKKEIKDSLVLSFDSSRMNFGKNFGVVIERVTSEDGVQINNWNVDLDIAVVEPLKIIKTSPSSGSVVSGQDLKNLHVCTNNPLFEPESDKFDEFFKISQPYTFFGWDKSYKITGNYNKYCQSGTYYTHIAYGLTPNKSTNLNLKFKDVYNTEANSNFTITTGDIAADDREIYGLQKEFSQATTKNTELTFRVENLPYIDVQICELTPERMLYYVQNKPLFYAPPRSISDCTNTVLKTIELKNTYWQPQFIQFDIKDYVGENPRGNYIVTLSHPEYKRSLGYQKPYVEVFYRNYLSVSNLSISQKNLRREYRNNPSFTNGLKSENLLQDQLKNYSNLYWVINTENLQPVVGAKLSVYEQSAEPYAPGFSVSKIQTVETDADGIVRTTTSNNLNGVVVTHNGEEAILVNNSQQLASSNIAELAERVYIFTDRPIYRPEHEVFIKGIYRIGYDGSYEVYRENKAHLVIKDSLQEIVHEEDLDINAFGTFKTDFRLPANAKLGTYSICAFSSCQTISVEEFVPSPFEVEVNTSKDEYISGEELEANLKANYFFGVPLEGGDVTYTVSSQDYYFDKYQDEYFNFGIPWYFCYGDCYSRDKYLLSRGDKLDLQGKSVFKESLDIAKLFEKEEERGSKIIVLGSTVKSVNGDSISNQKSFIVHAGEYYIGVKADKPFVAKDEKINLRIKTVNTDGVPTRVGNLKVSINKVRWVRNKRQEVDGGFYNRYVKETETVYSKNISTNGNGDDTFGFSLKDAGEYEVLVEGEDNRSNKIKNSNYTLYVYGNSVNSVMPTNDTTLEVVADNQNLNVGDTANVVIKSPFETAKALVTIERGHVFSYEVISLNGNLNQYSFPISTEHIPNINFSALVVSTDPEVKYGTASFSVGRVEKDLTIDVQSKQDNYLPGEKVDLDITVLDSSGTPVSAELSLAVVDASVLALKGNPKKNPVVFFYNGFPLTVETSNNLSNILKKVDIKPGKGGGGGDSSDLTKKKRGKFEDTAFWRSQIVTDENGKAKLSFTLPDNLTRWQVESVGVTKDTKVGVGYEEFTVQKRVMLQPLQPRFIIPGDEFSIGAQVFNQTETRQKVEVELTSPSLVMLENNSQNLTLKAGETRTIYFKVKAPNSTEEGEHVYTASVVNKDYEDVVEKSVKIKRNETFETTATANYSKANSVNEYFLLPGNVVQDRGELKIRSSATLAVFLTDAFNEMVVYPYACTEQIGSQMSTVAILKKASNLPNVGDVFGLSEIDNGEGGTVSDEQFIKSGLARLYTRQRSDGGFTYYSYADSYYAQSNFYLSLSVLESLTNIRGSGYEVDENVTKRLIAYLQSNILNSDYFNNDDLVILTAYTLSNAGAGLSGQHRDKISSLAANKKFLNEKASSLSLSYLAMVVNQGYTDKNKNLVFDALQNRIVLDSRGAYVKTHATQMPYYYETPIKTTAIALKALVKDKNDNEIIGNMLRWLLQSRDKYGVWGSTNNTISVVDSFTDFLAWQRETEAEFELTINIADEKIGPKSFNADNIFEQYKLERSVADLPKDEVGRINFAREFKTSLDTNLYYDMALRYFLPAAQIPSRDEGFTIERGFYELIDKKSETPITEAKVGDVLRGKLKIYLPHFRNFVAVEDHIPAGTELVNFNLATADKTLQDYESKSGTNNKLNPSFEETHDDRLFLFTENLPAGVYEYEYFVRVAVPGVYQHLPAMVSEMYSPENFGRTSGQTFTIKQSKD